MALFLTNDNFVLNDPILLRTQFTISVWIQLKSYLASQTLMTFSIDGTNLTTYMFGLTSTGNDSNIYIYNGFFDETYTSNSSLSLDKWQHLAFVLSFQTVLIYIDGSEVYSTNTSNFFPAEEFLHVKVGNLNGYLDDLKIFSDALSKKDIEAVSKETYFKLTYSLSQSCANSDISQEQDYGEIKSEC